MARLWQSGFELNTTTASVEWTTVTNGTIQTSTVRSGTYAGQITSLASGAARGFLYQFAAAAGSGPYFIRFYFRYATAPSAANTIFSFDDDTTVGEASACAIKLTSGGALQLFNGASQVGSDSSALSADTWYRVEVQYDGSPAAGSEVLRAKIDGTEFAGANNLTLAATVHSISLGGNLRSEAQTTGNWFFDDVAINDNTGSFQTSYPGEGSIIHLRPNAAGDNTAWVDGPHTDSYADVDEVTPDDATSYIASSDNTTEISDFNLDATPAAISSGATINVVAVGVRFAGETGDTDDTDFALRIKASSGGTVEELVDIDVRSTTWATNNRIAPRNYPLVLYDLPGASTTAWTKADLDTAQIGVRANQNAGFDQEARVSTLWLSVDYVSGTAYTSSLSGTLSFTGAVTKVVNKAQTGALGFTGSQVRSVARSITGSLSFTGTTAKLTARSLTSSLSFTGIITKIIAKVHTGVLSFSGSLSKFIFKVLAGTLGFSGSVNRFVSHILAGVLSFTGSLTTSHVFNTSFTATLDFVGNLTKQTSKTLGADLSFSGAMAKLTGKIQSATVGFAGSLTRLTGRSLEATLSFVGSLVRSMAKVIGATLSFAGAINKQTARTVSASVSFSGDVLKDIGYILSATLSFSGNISRSTAKTIVGMLSFIGNLTSGSLFNKTFTATLDFVGNLSKQTLKDLNGQLSFTGAIAKLTVRSLAATLSFAGTIATLLIAVPRVVQEVFMTIRGDNPNTALNADSNTMTAGADDPAQTLQADASSFTIEGDSENVTINNEVT